MDYSRYVCAYRIFKYKTMNINAKMKKCTVSKTVSLKYFISSCYNELINK